MTPRKTWKLVTWIRSRPIAPIVIGSACFILGSGALAQADWLPPGTSTPSATRPIRA